jgi:hypothetical protein
MMPSRRARIGLGLAAGLLAGCATTGAPPDDVEGKIRTYYAAHASEEDGACPSPEIASITKRKVQQSAGARTVLRVRYSYFDPGQGSTPAWMPSVLLAPRACTGFAERDFTLEQATLGYRVVAMSGPERDQEAGHEQ